MINQSDERYRLLGLIETIVVFELGYIKEHEKQKKRLIETIVVFEFTKIFSKNNRRC